MKQSKCKWVRLGDYIEQVYDKNTKCLYGEEDAIGVNIDKLILPMKGNLDNKKWESFFVVNPEYFVYNPRGSRKLGLGYNNTKNIYITTFNNVMFRVCNSNMNSEYLFLYLSRKEWDREAEYRSWGSSTEVFSWSTLCEIQIPLPSIEDQRKVVNAWKALREIKEQNEAIYTPTMQVCQSYIQELKHKYESVEIGLFIEETSERNGSQYSIDSVRGVSVEKIFIDTKANMEGVSLSPYKIVHKDEFCFVTITSRNSDKITLALNKDDEDYIVSSSYVTFKIKEPNKIVPAFLHLWYCRSEFDRYARFHSWGSAREAFSFDDMCRVRIPLPPLSVQQAIVNLYNCANEAKKIAEEADRKSREICPALIQYVINK